MSTAALLHAASKQQSTTSGIGILGTGSYLPERAVDNGVVGPPANVDDEWIRRKTGIHSRRWADTGQATSDLGLQAARRALQEAEVAPEELSLIVLATSTPDSPQPPTATRIASALGAPPEAAAFDINAVCSGFVFALDVAQRFTMGATARTLVIAADVYSPIIDRADHRTAVLLGDGAGATVLGPAPRDRGLLDTRLLTFGDYQELVQVTAGGSRLPTSAETLNRGQHYFTMRGREVTEFVRTHVPAAVTSLLRDNDVQEEEVAHLVPHQGNGKLVEMLADDLKLSAASTHSTVDRYGNTGAASIAVTLDDAARAGRFSPGQLVLLAGFGGGMSIGLTLIRW